VINSNDTIVEFEVIVPGMLNTVIDTFNRVSITNHYLYDSAGYPEVPVISFLVAIPECDSVYLYALLQDSTILNDFNIYPVPELISDTTSEGYVSLTEKFSYNNTVYETNALFPGVLVETINKGAIREQNCIRVLIYPVQFNPVTKVVNAYSKIKVFLTFENPSGSVNENVGLFNDIVSNSLINYNSNGLNASVSCGAGLADSGSVYWVTELPNQRIDTARDYLIITHQNFYNDTNARIEIEKLAWHRAVFNGFDVAIVKMNDIQTQISGLFDDVKIWNLINNTYDSGYANHTFDGKLAYLNLFGDVFFDNNSYCVPTHPYNNPLGNDSYFSKLSPNDTDSYPDIMLGHCSVDDTEQVQNVIFFIFNDLNLIIV